VTRTPSAGPGAAAVVMLVPTRSLDVPGIDDLLAAGLYDVARRVWRSACTDSGVVVVGGANSVG
jgi:hypothetical protein